MKLEKERKKKRNSKLTGIPEKDSEPKRAVTKRRKKQQKTKAGDEQGIKEICKNDNRLLEYMYIQTSIQMEY